MCCTYQLGVCLVLAFLQLIPSLILLLFQLFVLLLNSMVLLASIWFNLFFVSLALHQCDWCLGSLWVWGICGWVVGSACHVAGLILWDCGCRASVGCVSSTYNECCSSQLLHVYYVLDQVSDLLLRVTSRPLRNSSNKKMIQITYRAFFIQHFPSGLVCASFDHIR